MLKYGCLGISFIDLPSVGTKSCSHMDGSFQYDPMFGNGKECYCSANPPLICTYTTPTVTGANANIVLINAANQATVGLNIE